MPASKAAIVLAARASLTPYLGASTTRVDTDAFNELGGFGFGLRGDANRVQRSQMLAGIRGERGWGRWTLRGTPSGATARRCRCGLAGQLRWCRCLGTLAGWDAPRGSALFGVALESWWGRNGRLSLGFDQRVGGEGARQAALRYSTGF